MNSLLNRSILEITQQQDCETLQSAMLFELISLYQPDELLFYTVHGRSPDHQLQLIFNYSKQQSYDDYQACFVTEAGRALMPDEYAMAAITSRESLVDDGGTRTPRILVPICPAERAVFLLELAIPGIEPALMNELHFLITVYENFYTVLNNGERDTLTGLFNRRTFDAKLNKMLTAQKQQKLEKLSSSNVDEQRHLLSSAHAWLAVIDVDLFKRVNDQFGHLVGDEVLLRLAQNMQSCFRSTDLLFRFGGEEFVVVLEPIPFDMAMLALERFRTRVENFSFPLVNQVTISIGFAKITESDFPATILEYADKALYFAKDQGRNRVYSYEMLVSNGSLKPSHEDGSIDLF